MGYAFVRGQRASMTCSCARAASQPSRSSRRTSAAVSSSSRAGFFALTRNIS
jgi:hypothetical protein